MRRRRTRYRDKVNVELNITAFMNLMVILVPFLLITAVFSQITTLQLNIPKQSTANIQQKNEVQIEVIIRADVIEVGDTHGGVIQRILKNEEGFDLKLLADVMQQIKIRLPDKNSVSILMEQDIAYDNLVQVMDVVRVARIEQDGNIINSELFPDISIGDAPPRQVNSKQIRGKKS